MGSGLIFGWFMMAEAVLNQVSWRPWIFLSIFPEKSSVCETQHEGYATKGKIIINSLLNQQYKGGD